MLSELRGRMREMPAGKEKTGTSEGGTWEEKPPCETQGRDVDRTRVGKGRERVPGKAAMAQHVPVP